MKKEYRDRFNATAAYEWFKDGIEGLPYGYHNFVWGWVDTEFDNLPPLLRPELVAPVFSIFEKFYYEDGYSIINAGINMRLGTTNLSIPELDQVIFERNLTWPKVF